MIVTVLGSCVATCIQDKVTGIGGMNHFMLPINNSYNNDHAVAVTDDTEAARYGNVAMERLINNIVQLGGNRHNMEAKVFGGGRITNTGIDIGAENIRFVHEYLNIEGIKILSEDTGDIYPRKVYYIPETNDVFVKKVLRMDNTTIINREFNFVDSLNKTDTESQVFFYE